LECKARGGRTALLSGGEVTVTVTGGGKGGPNQEYALALVDALEGAKGICALAADTDGTDGGEGLADDPAGAIVDPSTPQRAAAKGLNPAKFLQNNDSSKFFGALDDLVMTGPTRTNVNDFRVILIDF
ncbi:MAG TPA: glycerate kinase, partial [Rhizobiales bacterium]|nr:glycerate kinase [Hyphomicrobiales bacterium]